MYYLLILFTFLKIIMHQSVKLTEAIWLLQLAISSPLIHALGDMSQAPTGLEHRSPAWEAGDLLTELSLPLEHKLIKTYLYMCICVYVYMCISVYVYIPVSFLNTFSFVERYYLPMQVTGWPRENSKNDEISKNPYDCFISEYVFLPCFVCYVTLCCSSQVERSIT